MLRKSLRGVIVTAAIAVLAATTADVASTDVTFTLGQPTASHGAKGKGRPTCLVSNKRTGLGQGRSRPQSTRRSVETRFS